MGFKLGHLSDLHLGYKSTRRLTPDGINVREADGYRIFSQIIDQVIEREVDAVVVAGDIFHSPSPEVRAVVFAQEQFRRLADANILVYILAGNHDTNDIRADIAGSKILDDPFRKIYSHVEPYVVHEIGDGILLHMISHHMYSEQAETMKEVRPKDENINIFSTHGSCIDPLLKEKLHTDQSPREIVIPDFLLHDFEWDYMLLGHIHERGWVGSKDGKRDTLNKKIYYNGSTIRRGFSDKEVPLGRGWTLWNIDSSGKFTPEHVALPQRTQLDFPIIDAKTLNSQEVTDLVISNLKNTQTDGVNFVLDDAPMLRQRIINLSPAKYASLDLKNINTQSQHAMNWSIKVINDVKEIEEIKNASTTLTDMGDVVTFYDNWVKSSEVYKDIDSKIQEKVKVRARDFVRSGQESTLDTNEVN